MQVEIGRAKEKIFDVDARLPHHDIVAILVQLHMIAIELLKLHDDATARDFE